MEFKITFSKIKNQSFHAELRNISSLFVILAFANDIVTYKINF